MNKNLKKALQILSIFVICLVIFTKFILFSFVSTIAACYPVEEKTLNYAGIYVLGQASQNTGNITIENRIIDTNSEKYRAVQKHELCHLKQFQSNRLNSCVYGGILRFGSEFECYVAQSLPDRVFVKLYL